ncbi:helix-turn-helix domain-containing protein [Actinacidiphila guanduensis]|uniref:Helix-turn-helix domain-containing protein n=1 Tax=Actinacidiphila guanduensis TaxID=310781 RepID=A0A1G9Z5X7_9ACTN|nr:helix-turn-helix transcriptional regulator [Actinacidiphila guanduensis]SDN16789.1 Helix-turn-helix domain-containing protein [Actinacidiphila guanduensis]
MTTRQPRPKTGGHTLDPSASPRALYGAELRHHRERKGLSQAELARRLFITTSHLANLESGRRRIHIELAREVDRILETGDFFVRNIDFGREPSSPASVVPMGTLEPQAVVIRDWDAQFLPGLLQTRPYAQALTDTHNVPKTSPNGREQHGATRVRTTPLHPGATTPSYHVILSESAIRRPVGTAKVMADQLQLLLLLASGGRIDIRVLPLGAEPQSALASALRIMTLQDGTILAHLQSHQAVTRSSDPAVLATAWITRDFLHTAALPPDPSLTLIATARNEYAKAAQAKTRQAPTATEAR